MIIKRLREQVLDPLPAEAIYTYTSLLKVIQELEEYAAVEHGK